MSGPVSRSELGVGAQESTSRRRPDVVPVPREGSKGLNRTLHAGVSLYPEVGQFVRRHSVLKGPGRDTSAGCAEVYPAHTPRKNLDHWVSNPKDLVEDPEFEVSKGTLGDSVSPSLSRTVTTPWVTLTPHPTGST